MRQPVELDAADAAWLEDLVGIASVAPLEGGDLTETERAQATFRAGAEARGLTTILHAAPGPEILVRSGVPLPVVEAAEAEARFLERQPSVVLGIGDDAPPERTLVLNFHIDTVGPHIPPQRHARRLLGRGTADAKGPGVAATVGVARAFADDPALAERMRVLIQSVPGEEGGSMGVYGTRWLVDEGFIGKLMVFAEPTGMAVLDSCTATMTALVSVRGKHSTDDRPEGGDNATLALGWLAAHLARVYAPVVEATGGRITIAGVHTGQQHNRVYGSGELYLNIAYPTVSVARVLERELETVLAGAGAAFAADLRGIAIADRMACSWNDAVRSVWLKRGIPVLTGQAPALTAQVVSAGFAHWDAGPPFTCDAVWAGGPDRHVVVCGPGRLEANGVHTPNEFIDLEDLDTYSTRIRELVHVFADHLPLERSRAR
jgi:acetylornithine deacetylase/succinyl-diaminopimelate desuccinylase-like protein